MYKDDSTHKHIDSFRKCKAGLDPLISDTLNETCLCPQTPTDPLIICSNKKLPFLIRPRRKTRVNMFKKILKGREKLNWLADPFTNSP